MPIVFLISQPSISRHKKPPNLEPLYAHGEVRVIVPTGKSPTYNAPDTMETVEGKMENFNPDTDFLVWAGGDVLCAVFVGMYLADCDIWEFNWLKYERRRLEDGTRTNDGARYVPVRVDLREGAMPVDGEHEEDDDLEEAV